MFCYGSPAEAEELCEMYSAQSGVSYRWFRQHEAYRVVPVMPDVMHADKDAANKLSREMRSIYMAGCGQGFDMIVRDCDLPLILVLGGAKWLVEQGKAAYIVSPLDVPWGVVLLHNDLVQSQE